jgi:hypothetical protein
MANVYTSVSNQAWFTDKCRIATGNTAVTFNVDRVALTYQQANGTPATAVTAAGNIYSNAVSVPANYTQEVYVGVGNKLWITGSNFTATEIGTASSATAGVNGVGS